MIVFVIVLITALALSILLNFSFARRWVKAEEDKAEKLAAEVEADARSKADDLLSAARQLSPLLKRLRPLKSWQMLR